MLKKRYVAKKNSLTMAKVNRGVLGDLLRLTLNSGQGSAKVPIVSHTTESELSRRY